MADLVQYRKLSNSLLAEHRQAKATVDQEEKEKERVATALESVLQAQKIVQSVAQSIQQRVHQRIAAVVTRCLTAVFEDPYEFSIRFEQSRGKTEAVPVFYRDGVALEDPENEVGGGVLDVTALALRLAAILLSRPPLRRFLSLDEPFSNIRGKENRARTRQMLIKICEELGFQMILSTDIPEYRLGTILDAESWE